MKLQFDLLGNGKLVGKITLDNGQEKLISDASGSAIWLDDVQMRQVADFYLSRISAKPSDALEQSIVDIIG